MIMKNKHSLPFLALTIVDLIVAYQRRGEVPFVKDGEK